MNTDDLIEAIRPRPDLGEPAYHQIANAIERLVHTGSLAHGSRLPVERSLAESLGVSRVTVRSAYQTLEERGVAVRKHGSGTYLNHARIEGNIRVLPGLAAEIADAEHDVRTRVESLGYHVPDATVRRELRVPGDAKSTVRLVRVRTVDGVQSSLEISWMPAAIGADLIGTDLTNLSLFTVLRETKAVYPARASETVRASLADAESAALLGTTVGAAVFLVDRTTFDREGRPVEFARSVLRGDQFVYTADLTAPGIRLSGLENADRA